MNTRIVATAAALLAVASVRADDDPLSVRIRVIDAASRAPLFARVLLEDDAGEAIGSAGYAAPRGHFVHPEGWSVSLAPGVYRIEVDAGFEHAPYEERWELAAQAADTPAVEKTIALERWVDMRAQGWYAGGDHNHVVRGGSESKNYGGTQVTLEFAAAIMASRGWDYYAAGGGGAWVVDGDGICDARDEDNERFNNGRDAEKALAAWNARYGETCHLWWNNEHVKGRFGHLWLLGAADGGIRYPYSERDASAFWSFYDVNWDPWQADRSKPIGPFASELWPIPPMFDCIRSWRDQGLVAFYAHPTRSWRSDGVHWCNIAAAFPFDLLAGAPVGGLVVMGDHFDHANDQTLWFAALNEGFKVPGLAENDTVFGRDRLREKPHTTYTFVRDMGERFDLRKVTAGIAAGRSFLSSGAFCTLRVDGAHGIGDTVRLAEAGHELAVHARASSDPEDAIDRVEVIVNGVVVRRIEEAAGRRVYDGTVHLDIEGPRAWAIVKVLCRKRPAAALTNAVYFRAEGERETPEPLRTLVTGRVTRDGTGVPARIVVRCWNEVVRAAQADADGRYRLEDVPVAAHLEYSHDGASVQKAIFFDDPDYASIHARIYATEFVGAEGALATCFPPDFFSVLRDMARHVEIDAEL